MPRNHNVPVHAHQSFEIILKNYGVLSERKISKLQLIRMNYVNGVQDRSVAILNQKHSIVRCMPDKVRIYVEIVPLEIEPF